MKKQIQILILFVILIANNHFAFGVVAYPYPVVINQSDGTKITIIQKGDEYVHWAQTVDGYSIMRNKKGIYEYATKDIKNDLAPSGIKARNQSERSSSEIQFLNKTKKMLSFSKTQIGMMKDISKMKLKSAVLPSSTTGSRKLLCILMGFADKAFTKTKADFENLFNQVGYTTDGATGSVHDFYKEASYGQLDLSTTVVGPFTASHNMAFYGANRANAHEGGGNDTIPGDLVKEAVLQADPSVNYADFDNDNNGTVDGIYVIYAGYGEDSGGGSDAIWAHMGGIPSFALDGKYISSYACSSELRGYSGIAITRIGVICHEFGHVLGASDFYDTNYGTDGYYGGTGPWDLMAGGEWNNNGATPAHHNPYTKIYQYGWSTAKTLTTAANITLANAEENNNNFYRVNTDTPNEFFIIENRQKQKFDYYIPGHGMVIYHVDKNNFGTFNGINGGSHQGIYPVCANAAGNPPNDYGDIYSSGTTFPGTGNKTSFTDLTTPNALSWAGVSTNKPITFITENNSNETISFSFLENTSAPSVTTVVATGITNTSATLNAKVRANNLATTITFEYGLTTDYGSSLNGTPNTLTDTTLTSISATLTGLTANATYNFRVKAVNSLGTTYGENMTFTANSNLVLNLPVTENFNASTLPLGWTTQNIGDGITERWSMSNWRCAGGTGYELNCSWQDISPGVTRVITPAINTVGIIRIALSFKQQFGTSSSGGALLVQSSKDKITWTNENWSVPTSPNALYSGITTVYTTITNNLNTPNTYIAFVVSGNLHISYWYIDNVSLTLGSAVVLPVVTTTTASSITSTAAKSGGNISSDGGAMIIARGVCWSTTANPTIALNTKTINGTGSGPFSSNITGLTPQTTYHVRAYATNSAGTAYGTDIQFTTNSVVNVPTLTTTTASSITMNSASSGGTILDDGGSAVTAKGICWGTSTNPTINLSTKTMDGTGIDAFISSIIGLKPGNPYHIEYFGVKCTMDSGAKCTTFSRLLSTKKGVGRAR